MKRLVLIVLALGACKFADPAGAFDAGGGGTDGSSATDAGTDTGPDAVVVGCGSDCRLLALSTGLANTGTTLTLEGHFGEPTIVHFPGGVDATATTLGPNRASVVVPPTATAGALSVTSGGRDIGALPFHRAADPLALQALLTNETQESGARRRSALVTTRFAPSAVQIGDWVYVGGGFSSSSGYVASVDRAEVYADGSLGAFSPVSSMTAPRASLKLVGAAGFLYAIGGDAGVSSTDAIERAKVNADGSLGPWSVLSQHMLHASSSEAVVIVGDSLYAFAEGTVERSVIGLDGDLGAFTEASAPVVVRGACGVFVAGSFLYVVGGADSAGTRFDSVERAPIQADGSLGAFAIVEGTHLPTAVDIQNSFAVAGDRIYVFGGETATGTIDDVVSAQIAADGTVGPFAKIGSFPEARRLPAVAMVGDSLYLFGGRSDATGAKADVWRASFHAGTSLSAFDAPAAPTMVTPRKQAGSAVVGNFLYIFGGTPDASSVLRQVERAAIAPDGSIGAFAATGPLVTARRSGYVVVTGPFVYVVGGLDASGARVTTVERASISVDGSIGTFATVSGVTVSHSSGSAVIVGDSLFLIAQDQIAISQIGADGALGTFSSTSSTLAHGHVNPAQLVVNNSIYLLGGGESNGAVHAQIERATVNTSGDLSSWSSAGTLAVAVSDESALLLGQKVFVFGGGNGSSTLSTVQSATIGASGSMAFAKVVSLAVPRNSSRAALLHDSLWLVGGEDSASTIASTPLHATLR